MLEIGIVIAIVGAIWFLRRGNRPSLPGMSLNFSNTNWRRPLLILGAVGVFYAIFFTEFSVKIFEWDWANTPLGVKLEEKFGGKASMMMWLGVAVTAIVIGMLFKPKSTQGSQTSGNNHSVLVGILTGIVALTAGIWIVLSTQGNKTKVSSAAECATSETSMDFRVDVGGRDVTVCRDENSFILLPIYGHSLQFEISPKFKRENEHLLTSRSLDDFVTIQLPQTYGGSVQEGYKVSPVKSVGIEFTSAFDRSGLDRMTVTVRAVPRYRQ